MIDARFYYQTPDAEPLLVEVFSGYVNFLDGSVSKRIDTLPGKLVKLAPITPEFQEAVEEAIDLAGEAIPYAGAYFDGKWGLSARYEKANTVIRAWQESIGYAPARAPAPAGDEGRVVSGGNE